MFDELTSSVAPPTPGTPTDLRTSDQIAAWMLANGVAFMTKKMRSWGWKVGWPEDWDGSRLLTMTDAEVRKRVGECFAAQLRTAGAVHGAFFAGSPAPPVPLPAGTEWVGGVAVALVAWAMAQTVHHGFAACVDAAKAKAAVTAKLAPSNPAFVALARANYDALFAAHCRPQGPASDRTFGDLTGSDAARMGLFLVDKITSDEFISKEMLTFAANPAGFYQKIYLLLYQVWRLNPAELDGAKRCWATVLERKGLSFRWTIHEAMQADRFNEQTFLPEVQAVINQQTARTPINTWTSVTYTYAYGDAAAKWLDGLRGTYDFFTDKQPTNVVSVTS